MLKKQFILIPLALIFLACNKNSPPISQNDIWDCHHDQTLDSTAIANHLLGEWDWEYVSCFWTPDEDNGEVFKGLKIKFKSDNSLELMQNDSIIQTSNWNLVIEDADLYGINTTPSIEQIRGRILICDDIIEFNESYIDGCDHYFEKLE